MKQSLSFFIVLFFITITEIFLAGCANIIPPGGGPRDTIPPIVINANPNNYSKQFNSYKIVLSFNEFIEVKDIAKNIIVSPLPTNSPFIDYKLKTITIKLRDILEPNTTYSLNFGNSIVDINESNPLINYTYVFSTGNSIDSCKLHGKVILAETGKTDSTLIAVLYQSISDTAVVKLKPKYITRLKGDGSFSFNYIPSGTYSIFAMPNDYAKKYNDSTKLFAFSDSLVHLNNSSNQSVTLYAFQEAKSTENTNINNSSKDKNENTKPKSLKYFTSLEMDKQDILNPNLELTFQSAITSIDTFKIALTDTNFNSLNNYSITLDSVNHKIIVNTQWVANTKYKLIINKDAVIDKMNNTIAKTDTIHFITNKETDYGALKIRFNNLDVSKNPVLLIYKQTQLIDAIKINNPIISKKLFKPGDFDLKILYDKNNNGIWSTGNYKNKIQPEIIIALDKKLSVRANWDNETEIYLKQ